MNEVRLSRIVGVAAAAVTLALLPVGAYAGADDNPQSDTPQSLLLSDQQSAQSSALYSDQHSAQSSALYSDQHNPQASNAQDPQASGAERPQSGTAQDPQAGSAQGTQASAAQSTFTLTIADGQNSRSVVLQCDPAGGDHPRAAAACEELRAANGNFENLRAGVQSTEQCTKDRRSVKATAQGNWNDRIVTYQYSADNACELHRSTGSVFAF
ncbi:hypothetical protein EIL87_06170 [Saccharopolyspora rhizosphaerae]|uniref:Subtilisin inhibitor domain-containing protein n=1 Tax=Saccharopolyspora rhizosphaerae TaxID=2492662 RepID=A0A426JZV6_9PSEU|nr:SSI family serine proteinase inhibitor [Saccharopolyspora rhizosphaerae]RRO18697.1 hypothetical protein EIL87_06170 [Saccharopolyspora rhizosphaerae]